MLLDNYVSNPYLRALILLLISYILIRLFILVTKKIVFKIAIRTRTRIDDLIIEKTRKQITFLAVLVSIRLALLELNLSDKMALIFPKIIYSLILLTVALMLYKLIDVLVYFVAKHYARKSNSKIDENLIIVLRKITKVVFFVIAAIYILNYWGMEIGPMLTGLGIAGIAVAFAMQSSLANIFGGVSLILDKTIRVGDMVEIDETTQGKIVDVGIRSTKLKTLDNEIIIIPNSKLADSRIKNMVLPEAKLRVSVQFTTSYGTKIDKVKKIVLDELKKIKLISKDPAPVVNFTEMGDSALIFKVFFHVDTYADKMPAKDEVNTRIYNAFNKHNIDMPFPQMDVHLKKK